MRQSRCDMATDRGRGRGRWRDVYKVEGEVARYCGGWFVVFT